MTDHIVITVVLVDSITVCIVYGSASAVLEKVGTGDFQQLCKTRG